MPKELRKNDMLILDEIRDFKEEFVKHKTTVEVVLLGADNKGGLCGKVEEHEKQIGILKNWRAQVIGAAAVLSMLIGILFKVFE